MLVGYARTSTVEQEAGLSAQDRDLRAAGCERVFSERISSVAKRSQLEAALDFVRDGDVLVVCEVKTRSSVAYGTPLEGVTEQKALRLRRLAARWLSDHGMRAREVRIDLVGVLVPAGGGVQVDHVRGLSA